MLSGLTARKKWYIINKNDDKKGIVMTSELRHNSDKRVIRTKKAIKNALFSLMECKDISVITISELTAAANVNRRTFYTHYRTITDILDEIENDLVTALTDMLVGVDMNNYGESVEQIFLQMHALITDEFDYYFHIMKLDTRAYLVSRLKKTFKTSVDTLMKNAPALPQAVSLASTFVAGGFLAFYTEWYYSPNRMPIEQAAKMVSAFAVSCRDTIQKMK